MIRHIINVIINNELTQAHVAQTKEEALDIMFYAAALEAELTKCQIQSAVPEPGCRHVFASDTRVVHMEHDDDGLLLIDPTHPQVSEYRIEVRILTLDEHEGYEVPTFIF